MNELKLNCSYVVRFGKTTDREELKQTSGTVIYNRAKCGQKTSQSNLVDGWSTLAYYPSPVAFEC